MEDKTTNAIYNLMQNIVDKLDELSNAIDAQKETKTPISAEYMLMQNGIIKHLNLLSKAITKKPENNSSTQPINNHYEYTLFGKDAAMDNRFLFVLIGLIMIAWPAFKFLPSHFKKQEQLEIENQDYSMLYEYLNLNNVTIKQGTLPVNKLMNDIKNREANFVKEFNALKLKRQKAIKKIQLEEELKNLEW